MKKENRKVWVEVDLGAIRHNLQQVKRRVGSSVKIMAVVKADAYGHGARRVSKVLVEEGVDALAVTDFNEGASLRQIGIDVPILILGSLSSEEIDSLLHYSLTPTIFDFNTAEMLSLLAKSSGRRVGVHINIDTGMGRFGISYKEAPSFIEKIANLEGLKIEGIYSHFSSAEEGDDFSHTQIELFQNVLKKMNKKGIYPSLQHISNSAGVINLPRSYFNMVRPGLIIYGYYPSPKVSDELILKPSMCLKTEVAFVRRVPKGMSLSYGRAYVTSEPASIAILPVGYAHGYPRCLSNKAEVLIRGERASLVGRICMDQTLVNVTHIKGVRRGDEVILWGGQGEEKVSLEEVSLKANTIPYELVTNVGKSVYRIYKDGN